MESLMKRILLTLLSTATTILLLGNEIYTLCTGTSYVVELTPENFETEVLKSNSVWMVEFYADYCGHCKNLEPIYTQVANTVEGIAKVGAINAEKYNNFTTEHNIAGYPTIRIYGKDKDEDPEEYIGKRTTKDLCRAIIREMKRSILLQYGNPNLFRGYSDVSILTHHNLTSIENDNKIWAIVFYIPWCTRSEKLSPKWNVVSKTLSGKVRFGAVNLATYRNKIRYYDIQESPTIMLLPKNKDNKRQFLTYEGDFSSINISNWIRQHLTNIPPPKINQITENIFNKDHNLIWIISFLPNFEMCQTLCRNNYLDILKDVSTSFKTKIWNWGWSEEGAQKDLEKSFNLTVFGYPALAAVNAKQKSFSMLRDFFNKTKIEEFLTDVALKRVDFDSFQNGLLPDVVEVESWNEKDNEKEMEDNIDESDLEENGVKKNSKDEL